MFKDLEEAIKYVAKMEPYGEYYSKEDTDEIMKFYSIEANDKFNDLDFYVAFNMVQNDYGDDITDEEDQVLIAKDFLADIDAPKGKMKIYLDAMYQGEPK